MGVTLRHEQEGDHGPLVDPGRHGHAIPGLLEGQNHPEEDQSPQDEDLFHLEEGHLHQGVDSLPLSGKVQPAEHHHLGNLLDHPSGT